VPTLSHWWSPVPAPSGPAPRQGGAPKCALLSGGAMVQCAGSQKVFACGHWILAGFSRPHHLTTSPLATPVRRIRVWGEFYQSPFEAWAEIICVRRNLAKNTRSPLLTSLLGLQPLVPHHHPTSKYAGQACAQQPSPVGHPQNLFAGFPIIFSLSTPIILRSHHNIYSSDPIKKFIFLVYPRP